MANLGYPGGISVDYAPNALGQPTQAGTYATNVSYYPNGAMQSFTYGTGIVHTLTRNARGLPDRSTDAYGATKILDDGYDYDANGNVAAISDGATGRNQRGNRTMAYDGLNRLVAVQSPMYGSTGAAYGYDSLDNLTQVVAPGRHHYYCYDGNNRLTNIRTGDCTTMAGATVIGLGYDLQGNLNNKNGVLYGFDQGNRLRSVSSPSTSYVYDGHGRRVRDHISGSDGRYSLYSQTGQLVFAQDNRQGTQAWYFSLNGSLVATQEKAIATGALSATYQHTDALGSPVAVTNASGVVIKRNEYEPYGKLVGAVMEDGPGYTGHMSDAATGLVYMQARYYDPTIDGRFPSVDPVTPISPGGTFNRYWYANANPYRFTDPDGRYSCSAGKAACASLAKAIQMIHDAAAKSTNSRVIAVSSMLGELGDPGVDISDKLRKPTNLGEAHTAGDTTTIGINFKQLDDIAEIASVVGHEGSHGLDQRARGTAGLDPMSNSRSELTISELRAGETEAKIFQALGSDNPFGLYTKDEGVNWQGINSQADLSVNQMCGGEHVCDP